VYQTSGEERLTELRDVPKPDVGAPLPVVVAAEYKLYLVYAVADSGLSS